jgi:hypothetical protein
METPPESFTITLTPVDNRVPAAVRLRQVLKECLRRHGMRCLDVRELRNSAPHLPPSENRPERTGPE